MSLQQELKPPPRKKGDICYISKEGQSFLCYLHLAVLELVLMNWYLNGNYTQDRNKYKTHCIVITIDRKKAYLLLYMSLYEPLSTILSNSVSYSIKKKSIKIWKRLFFQVKSYEITHAYFSFLHPKQGFTINNWTFSISFRHSPIYYVIAWCSKDM